MALKDFEGEQKATIDDLSYGFKNHLQETLLYGVIWAGISGVASMFSCFGAVVQILAGAFLMVTMPLIIHRKLAALDAIRTSANMMSPVIGMAILLSFLGGLISAIGLVACIIGIVFTVGFWGPLQASAYVRLTADPQPAYSGPAPSTEHTQPVTPEEVVSGEEDQGDTLADPGAVEPPAPDGDDGDTSADETKN